MGGEEVKVWVQTTCMGVEHAAPRVNDRVAEGRGFWSLGDLPWWEISRSVEDCLTLSFLRPFLAGAPDGEGLEAKV